jgi:dipeptidyl aminopeptidase/acylaminoacyl peptidase
LHLQSIEDANLPVIFVHGDLDEMVPVANTRQWVETAKEMKMDHEYKEVSGAGHGPIIEQGVGFVYEYFGKHVRGAKK